MEKLVQRILSYFERQSFGVCTFMGERFQISIQKLRLFFIYLSFLSVGFPLIIYFFAAFVLDFRNYVKLVRRRNWES